MRPQTLYDVERRKRFGRGKILSSFCQHGKHTIKDYEPYEYCALCEGGSRSFYVPDMTPRFNAGLGCETSGTRDAEKKAKKLGMTPIGDESWGKTARRLWPGHHLAEGW